MYYDMKIFVFPCNYKLQNSIRIEKSRSGIVEQLDFIYLFIFYVSNKITLNDELYFYIDI